MALATSVQPCNRCRYAESQRIFQFKLWLGNYSLKGKGVRTRPIVSVGRGGARHTDKNNTDISTYRLKTHNMMIHFLVFISDDVSGPQHELFRRATFRDVYRCQLDGDSSVDNDRCGSVYSAGKADCHCEFI